MWHGCGCVTTRCQGGGFSRSLWSDLLRWDGHVDPRSIIGKPGRELRLSDLIEHRQFTAGRFLPCCCNVCATYASIPGVRLAASFAALTDVRQVSAFMQNSIEWAVVFHWLPGAVHLACIIPMRVGRTCATAGRNKHTANCACCSMHLATGKLTANQPMTSSHATSRTRRMRDPTRAVAQNSSWQSYITI